MSDPVKYAVVIPVYNSTATLPTLINDIENQLEKTQQSFEIFLVDDHSRDETKHLVQQLTKNSSRLRAIRLEQNYGQFAATFIGVLKANGEVIITIDDDLQYPAEEIGRGIQFYHQHNYLLVYGHPPKNKMNGRQSAYHFLKRASVYANHPNTRHFMKGSYFPTGFRIFNKSNLVVTIATPAYYPYLDVYFYWCIETKQVGYINVNHKKRHSGKSGQTMVKKLNDALEILARLAKTIWPLLFYCTAGILTMLGVYALLTPGLLAILLYILTGCFTLGAFILLYKYLNYHFCVRRDPYNLSLSDKIE